MQVLAKRLFDIMLVNVLSAQPLYQQLRDDLEPVLLPTEEKKHPFSAGPSLPLCLPLLTTESYSCFL